MARKQHRHANDLPHGSNIWFVDRWTVLELGVDGHDVSLAMYMEKY